MYVGMCMYNASTYKSPVYALTRENMYLSLDLYLRLCLSLSLSLSPFLFLLFRLPVILSMSESLGIVFVGSPSWCVSCLGCVEVCSFVNAEAVCFS